MDLDLYTEIVDDESFVSSSRSNPDGFESDKSTDCNTTLSPKFWFFKNDHLISSNSVQYNIIKYKNE
jgi:hypothetical protein